MGFVFCPVVDYQYFELKIEIALKFHWVIRYVLKQILVMFETNLGYVLGKIYPKNAIDRHNHF